MRGMLPTVVVVGCSMHGGCGDAPVPDARAPAQPAAAAPSDSAPSGGPELGLDVLVGFRGEAHAVVGLPDGGAIVALSWFVRTDFGAGEMRTEDLGRQAHVVRYDANATVKWATPVALWPADLAYDGDHTVLVVGETRAATTHAMIDTTTGAVVHSGFVDGYPKHATFSGGRALVLSLGKGATGAVIDDVTAEPARWPWRPAIDTLLAMAAAPGGGVEVLAADVDGRGQLTAIALDRVGTELWRRSLCATSLWGSIVVEADGTGMIVACEPARIIRLGSDGVVLTEIPLAGDVRPQAIANHGGKLVIGGQLLGELAVGDRTFASWETVDGDDKSGHGDAIALVHDGKAIVGVVHGHGMEADQAVAVAATTDAIWVVGAARHSLDFGGGKLAAPDPDGAGIGFIARARGR